MEAALEMSEKRFRAIVDQSPLSIQILSPDGYTVRVNRAWEELWGVTLEDLAGYNILEDPQLVEKGIMPFIRKGLAGESTPIPPVPTTRRRPYRTSRATRNPGVGCGRLFTPWRTRPATYAR